MEKIASIVGKPLKSKEEIKTKDDDDEEEDEDKDEVKEKSGLQLLYGQFFFWSILMITKVFYFSTS